MEGAEGEEMLPSASCQPSGCGGPFQLSPHLDTDLCPTACTLCVRFGVRLVKSCYLVGQSSILRTRSL